MTTFEYNQKMADLCRRMGKAYAAKGDRAMADTYDHAEEGFFARSQSIAFPLAAIPVSRDLEQRVMELIKDCVQLEEEAAWVQKEFGARL